MVNQSVELTGFYRMYRAWLNMGAPPSRIFQRSNGLCIALAGYTEQLGMRSANHEVLSNEMDTQFIIAGLNPNFPFNEKLPDGGNTYWCERETRTMHLNPKRIKWVEDHCNVSAS
jgi:hypothetical protein